MAQNIFTNINPATTSGPDVATLLNNFKAAVLSGLSGTARPTELASGGCWIDTSTFGKLILRMFDGTHDVPVITVDMATNKIVYSEFDLFEAAVYKQFASDLRPAKTTKGGLWVDNGTPNQLSLKMYDGTHDVTIATVNSLTSSIFSTFQNAVRAGFLGSRRPPALTTGGMWVDNSVTNRLTIKMFDGIQDVSIATVNSDSHTLLATPDEDDASSIATKMQTGAITVERIDNNLRIETRNSEVRTMTVGNSSQHVLRYGWNEIDTSSNRPYGKLSDTSDITLFTVDLNISHIYFELQAGMANGKLEIGIQSATDYGPISTALKQAGYGISFFRNAVETKFAFTNATVAASAITFTVPKASDVFKYRAGDAVRVSFYKQADRRDVVVYDSNMTVDGFLKYRMKTLTDFPEHSEVGDVVKIDRGLVGERFPQDDITLPSTAPNGGTQGLGLWGDDIAVVTDSGAYNAHPVVNWRAINTYTTAGVKVAAKSERFIPFGQGTYATFGAPINPYGIAFADDYLPRVGLTPKPSIWVADNHGAISFGTWRRNTIWAFPIANKSVDGWQPSSTIRDHTVRYQLDSFNSTTPFLWGWGLFDLGGEKYFVGVSSAGASTARVVTFWVRSFYSPTRIKSVRFNLADWFRQNYWGYDWAGTYYKGVQNPPGNHTFGPAGAGAVLQIPSGTYFYSIQGFSNFALCWQIFLDQAGNPMVKFRPDLCFEYSIDSFPASNKTKTPTLVSAIHGACISKDKKVMYVKTWGTSNNNENYILALNIVPPGLWHRTKRGWESFEHKLIYEGN